MQWLGSMAKRERIHKNSKQPISFWSSKAFLGPKRGAVAKNKYHSTHALLVALRVNFKSNLGHSGLLGTLHPPPPPAPPAPRFLRGEGLDGEGLGPTHGRPVPALPRRGV